MQQANKKKKATIIPHSDLTLEWLHSIQPGKGGEGGVHAQGDTHMRKGKKKHEVSQPATFNL